jgi:hypothetical protein
LADRSRVCTAENSNLATRWVGRLTNGARDTSFGTTPMSLRSFTDVADRRATYPRFPVKLGGISDFMQLSSRKAA